MMPTEHQSTVAPDW